MAPARSGVRYYLGKKSILFKRFSNSKTQKWENPKTEKSPQKFHRRFALKTDVFGLKNPNLKNHLKRHFSKNDFFNENVTFFKQMHFFHKKSLLCKKSFCDKNAKMTKILIFLISGTQKS